MKDNQRFGLGLLAGTGLALGGWLLLLAGQLGQPHPDNLWVEQAYDMKIRAARQWEASPRVLVVGGSGAMFGIDSAQLSAAWGMPAINLGVNAGIGPQFIIDYALPLVKAGDIVIAPLEYPLYSYDGDINHVLLSFLLSHPEMLTEFPLTSLAKAGWTVPLKRVVEGYSGIPEGFRVAGLYGPHNLDANGDQLNSQLAQRDDTLHQAAVAKAAEEYGRQFSPDAAGWQLWRNFSNTLAQRGACVLFVPPPMMFKAEYAERDKEKRLYRDLPAVARRYGLHYLGDPRDFLYPGGWFFDTNYHLVAEQRLVYTQDLLALLGVDPAIKCAENTPI